MGQRKELMTWVESRKGWMKKHEGKMYSRSCKQLGCPPSRELSRDAANRWWMDQLATWEQPERQKAEHITQLATRLMELSAKQAIIGTVSELAAMHPDAASTAVTGVAERLMASVALPEPGKTVGERRNAFLDGHRLNVEAGDIAISRYDSYRLEVDKFVNWIGEHTPINAIDENKIQDFYEWLKKEKYGASYAKQIFTTMRQFIRHNHEVKMLVQPANLESRKFKFRVVKGTPKHWPIDYIRTVLEPFADGSKSKTQLYLLLMLNCGMTQADVSGLKLSEINFNAGTITRKRSKRQHDDNAQTVTYKLWNRTLELLKLHCTNKGDLALVCETGLPLLQKTFRADGKMSKSDNIRSAYRTLCKCRKLELKELSELRATGSQILMNSREYCQFADEVYLAHAPASVGEGSYWQRNKELFFEALMYMEKELFGGQS